MGKNCMLAPTFVDKQRFSGVNPILFWGALFQSLSHAGGEASKPEGPRAGVEFLERWQRAPFPPAMESRERCKLSQRGPGGTLENLKFDVTWDLKIHYRMPYNV